MHKVLLSFFMLVLPQIAAAQVFISEIMYDLPSPGTDTGHEWVEVCGDVATDLANWKFNEANTNHALSSIQGGTNVSAGGCAVIADDATKFLADYSGFSGALFDSSFSLNNTGETLALKDEALNIIDSVNYSSASGATGDGNSLQKINGAWSAAAPSPGAANTGNLTNLEVQPPSGGGSSAWPEYVPPEKAPKIKIEIVAEARAIAGAAHRFEARVFGTKNDPVSNARVIWNFGDGARGEGRFVAHTFGYPGTYLVVADAASGEYSASTRFSVIVESNALYVSEINPGTITTAWIEIANPGASTADLSGWFLESVGGNFIFPDNSILAPRSFTVFASESTKLNVWPAGDVKLLYPNGKAADIFAYSGELGGGETFQRVNGKNVVQGATPGSAAKTQSAAQTAATALRASVTAVTENKNEDVADDQLATIAASVGDGVGGKWWLWLAASGALGVFGAAAFLLMKNQTRKEAPVISQEAEEFEIEEI